MLLATIISLLSFSSITLAQPPETSEMIMGMHVSLGNSSCTPMECDLTWINFEIPLGTDKPQYLKFIITPECFSQAPTENETYSIDMYCMNGFNETIDLKTAQCNPANSIIKWVEVNDTTYGYYIHETNYCEGFLGWLWCLFNHQNPTTTQYYQYEDFWCAFKRTNDSTERLPIEFSVVVDTLGLTNPQEEGVLQVQRESGSVILNGIREIFTTNFNVFQILFYLASAIFVIIGFVVLIGGIPILIKWIIKKVTK